MLSVNDLTLREKIAQMLICGIDGVSVSTSTRALVKDTKAGGIILYGKNTPDADSTIDLTYELHSFASESGIPLIIAIDEEHGRVRRIKSGLTRFPDMASIGKLGDAKIVKSIAEITSMELLACGVNMNFAPVCDVNVNSDNAVIGDRSFSPIPETVSKMVAEYIKGGLRTGIALCAKHFPGHGDTSIDSHLDLPVVEKSLEEIVLCELVPFVSAIKAGVQTIMTAHILFPRIDALPATMSKKIISDILINLLGFKSVIISDDMEMGAIAKNYGMLDAFALSINAGVNMFIISAMIRRNIDIDELIDGIEKNVTDGLIDKEAIDASVTKIFKLKFKYMVSNRYLYNKENIMRESSQKFARDIADKMNT